jgi:hypothetical protein
MRAAIGTIDDYPWNKWMGLSINNHKTVDAVDSALTSRDVFTATLFHPAGTSGFDLPWYVMTAENGWSLIWDGTMLSATADLPHATVFTRHYDGGPSSDVLSFETNTNWSTAQSDFEQLVASPPMFVTNSSLLAPAATVPSSSVTWKTCALFGAGSSMDASCQAAALVYFYLVQ